MKEKLILMFGGRSAEYEVSLSSVYNVSKALDREKYDVIMIGMTRDGVWYRYTGSPWIEGSGGGCFEKAE